MGHRSNYDWMLFLTSPIAFVWAQTHDLVLTRQNCGYNIYQVSQGKSGKPKCLLNINILIRRAVIIFFFALKDPRVFIIMIIWGSLAYIHISQTSIPSHLTVHSNLVSKE